jgi:hypothetical protein
VRVVNQKSPFELLTGKVVSVTDGLVQTELDVFGLPTKQVMRADELEVVE